MEIWWCCDYWQGYLKCGSLFHLFFQFRDHVFQIFLAYYHPNSQIDYWYMIIQLYIIFHNILLFSKDIFIVFALFLNQNHCIQYYLLIFYPSFVYFSLGKKTMVFPMIITIFYLLWAILLFHILMKKYELYFNGKEWVVIISYLRAVILQVMHIIMHLL